MGKNQAYKAMQRARLGTTSAGPDEVEDGMVDGSFHSPEWHAARLASLKTSHTITWEEYKKKQKEDEIRKGELEKDTDKMMREYRAQLDAERSRKLSQGRNHSSHHHHLHRKRDRKDKDSKKRSSKRRKHSRRRSSESSSSSSSEDSSSSDEEEKESRRSKSRSKRSKKEKRHKSRTKNNGSNDEEAEGPVPLSRFFESVKS